MNVHRLILLPLVSGSVLLAGEWRITPHVTEPTLVTVQPGPEQIRQIRGDLNRLQIQDAEGHHLDVRIAKILEGNRAHSTVIRQVSGKILSAKPVPENRLELLCNLPDGPSSVVGLELEIPMKNFEREITVWGVGEHGTETKLVDAGILIDYSRYADVRNTRVSWDPSGFRTFRLELTGAEETQVNRTRSHMVRIERGEETAAETWSNSLQRPLQVEGITFFTEEKVLRKEKEIRSALETLTWREKEGEDGIRIFECDVGYQPITHLQVSSSTPVYQRRIQVYISDQSSPNTTWRRLAEQNVFSFSYRTTREANESMILPPTTPAALQVRIETGNRPPLEDVTFTLSGPQWGLTFLAEPEQELSLVTSDDPVLPSSATIQALLVQGHVPKMAEIGEPLTASPPASETSLLDLIGSRGFLMITLVIVAGVIGVSLLKAVKKLDEDGGSSEADGSGGVA